MQQVEKNITFMEKNRLDDSYLSVKRHRTWRYFLRI